MFSRAKRGSGTVKSQTSTVLLKSKLALKHEYPVYVVLKMFPFGSSEP